MLMLKNLKHLVMTNLSCTFMVSCLNEKHPHKKTWDDKERNSQFHFVDAYSSNTTLLHLFKMLSLNKLLEDLGRTSK